MTTFHTERRIVRKHAPWEPQDQQRTGAETGCVSAGSSDRRPRGRQTPGTDSRDYSTLAKKMQQVLSQREGRAPSPHRQVTT